MSYRELDASKIISTIGRLQDRIQDRFADSSLSKLCGELHVIADDTEEKIRKIARPNFLLRATVGLFVLAVFAGMIYSASLLQIRYEGGMTLADVVTIAEASINDVILMGAAVFFLFRIEGKIKRNKALKGLQELRTICHVIDMHQLTKDPSTVHKYRTMHSPSHNLSTYQLGRYLDYCSEMLALAGKVSALYANGTDDSVVLNSITEIENLSTGMSRKIWQKIMILDRTAHLHSDD